MSSGPCYALLRRTRAASASWHRSGARRARLALIRQGVWSACDVVLGGLIALMVVAGVEEHSHDIARTLSHVVGAQSGEADWSREVDDVGHAKHVAFASVTDGTMKCTAFQGGAA